MEQHKAPDRLRRRILASLERERTPSVAARIAAFGQHLTIHWRSLSAGVVSGVAATLVGSHLLLVAAGDEALVQQLTASHTRALIGNHLIDVVSSDQHTVKPWFAGKIDYSPRVADYAPEGFELAGGRLDYVNDRVVAALVYKRRLHMIDAYVWPSSTADAALTDRSRHGINVVEWTEGGMKYSLVSDVELGELHELARLMRAH
jgi:anti-sigma factor RsiW